MRAGGGGHLCCGNDRKVVESGLFAFGRPTGLSCRSFSSEGRGPERTPLVESGLSAFGPLPTKCGDASLIAPVPALLDEVSPFDTVPDVD
jgi:hypothetical protein